MRRLIFCTAILIVIVHGAWAQGGGQNAPKPDSESNRQQERIRLYPRPATDFLIVQLNKPHARMMEMSVRSLIGNLITVGQEIKNDYEVQLDLGGLPLGYYFLSVKNKKEGWSAAYRFLRR